MLPGGALLGRRAIGRGTTGAAHNRDGAQPGRHAARAARCQRSARLSRTFARILGQECTENGLCRPPFRHILARKDGGSTRRPPYQRNDYISWIERPKREATRRRISRRCSMSSAPATATKACPGRIPRAPRGGRRQIGRLERGECSFRMIASVVKAVYRNDSTVCRTVCCRKVSDEVVGNPSLYGPYARRHT